MEESPKIELYVDGGARGNPGPAAGGYVIMDSEGNVIRSEGFFLGEATNNIAEYSALLKGLESVREIDVREIDIFSDSELVVKQIIGEYRVKNRAIGEIYLRVQQVLLSFDRWQIRHIPREENTHADRLVNEALDDGLHLPKKRSSAADSESDTKIMLEVLNAPCEGACSAGMKKGMCFVFSEIVPPGLCVHAANSVLPSVISMRKSQANDSDNTLQIRCEKPECGGIFKISKV